jgi:hypothetical protein
VGKLLHVVKSKCDILGSQHPQFITVDDCCGMRQTIQKVFPCSEVLLDAKHMINRVVEKLSKHSPAYGAVTKSLHLYVCGGTSPVSSRNGSICYVDSRLPDPDSMIRAVDRWVDESRRLDANIFLPGFEKVLENQKQHIMKGCVRDPIIDDKWYVETTDSKFLLLRGTNRNESFHRRLNCIWPDKCGQDLGRALKIAYVFAWNATRIARPCSICPQSNMSGTDSIRLSSLIEARCPIQLPTVPLVPVLLQDTASIRNPIAAAFKLDTTSGNLMGSAHIAKKGVDPHYQRMDESRGSKRSSYTMSDGPPLVKVSRTSNVVPESDTTKSALQTWSPDLEDILRDIMGVHAAVKASTGKYDWKLVLKDWNERAYVTATKRQLKSKWQLLQRVGDSSSTKQSSMTENSNVNADGEGGSVPVEICADTSCDIQEDMNTTCASDVTQSDIPRLTQQNLRAFLGTSSSEAATTTCESHTIAADARFTGNYTLEQKTSTVVPDPPRGRKFSEMEDALIDYIQRERKNQLLSPQKRVKWDYFAQLWLSYAKVAKLNDPFAEIYRRTAEQLEQRCKFRNKMISK